MVRGGVVAESILRCRFIIYYSYMVRPAGQDRTAVEKRVTVSNGKGPTTPPQGATRESTGIIRRQRA